MQIDKEYIAMCDCPEIRDNLPPIQRGDWVLYEDAQEGDNTFLVLDVTTTRMGTLSQKKYALILTEDKTWVEVGDVIRIPSLEDLWGMSLGLHGTCFLGGISGRNVNALQTKKLFVLDIVNTKSKQHKQWNPDTQTKRIY